jgi:hypothetical protein
VVTRVNKNPLSETISADATPNAEQQKPGLLPALKVVIGFTKNF